MAASLASVEGLGFNLGRSRDLRTRAVAPAGRIYKRQMNRRPSRLLVVLLVAPALLVVPASASASAPTRIYSSEAAGAKPQELHYVGPPIIVGVKLSFTGLKWRHWGKTRAYARGQLRTCPNMADCTRRKARLVAYRKRFSPATELNWYTRLRYKTAAGKYTLKLPVPSH